MLSEQVYRKKKVLVTGGCGFIGKHLQARLSGYGADVSTIDKDIKQANSVNIIQCDICDYKKLDKIVKEISPEIVFHLAACIDRTSEFDIIQKVIENNIVGSFNLFKSLNGCPSLKSVIVAGTSEEYGNNQVPFREEYKENPASPYSFSKVSVTYLSKMLFNIFKLPIIILRPTLAYGPGQEEIMFIPALIKTLLRNQSFKMTSGEQTRDFVYIDDLVDAYIRAGVSERFFGEIFNIGSGKEYKIKDIALRVASLLKKESLLLIGAKDYRKVEILSYYADISKAKISLGWAPKISLDEGLKSTIKAYSEDNG